MADGIIDPARWRDGRRKVLLLLKDPYEKKSTNEFGDLRKHVGEYQTPRNMMWKTAALWCHVAQAAPHIPDFHEKFEKESPEWDSLLGSAAIDVKKAKGKSTSVKKELGDHVNSCSDLLSQQIDLIGPKVVICANTWGFLSKQKPWSDAKEVSHWVYKQGERFFIDFWYPSGSNRASSAEQAMKYFVLAFLLKHGAALK